MTNSWDMTLQFCYYKHTNVSEPATPIIRVDELSSKAKDNPDIQTMWGTTDLRLCQK
jgi:hypothetical protein